ncbi:MAG TPA: cytochrome c [Bryobacteraceae bacterium]|jgi:mono/diheme cytochrome c family protein|nr:cytochrome c [Bryobacteraceae bacterium]
MTGRVMRAVVAACLLPVVLSADDRRPIPWEKHRLLIGQALYRENCVVCHDIDRQQSKKPGPSFYQLFKRDKMPLGNLKPSREYIKIRVKFGGSLMPAFRQTLTDSEIDTLIDYIAAK